jgi:peroxiredoxin Q/BCP
MVIGVSGDSLARHRDFAERRQLPYPLLSDTDGAIRRAYGIAPMLGLFPGRVTFVIDKEGTVRHIYRALLSGQRHTTEALEVVRQLQGQNAAPKTA